MMHPERLPEGPEEQPSSHEPQPVADLQKDIRAEIGQVSLTADQMKLIQRRAAGEIAPHDMDMNSIDHILRVENRPLTRADVRNEAIVLKKEDLERLEYILFIGMTGDEVVVRSEDFNDTVLVIFPEELGD